jgi:transcriptional regulator with XRE-family HTH domain
LHSRASCCAARLQLFRAGLLWPALIRTQSVVWYSAIEAGPGCAMPAEALTPTVLVATRLNGRDGCCGADRLRTSLVTLSVRLPSGRQTRTATNRSAHAVSGPCYGLVVGRGQRPRGRPLSQTVSSLGQRIREKRLSLGLSQAELGAPRYQAGYLSDVEHGRVTPSLKALEHIAGRLGLPMGELLGVSPATLRPAEAVAKAHRMILDALTDARPEQRPHLAAAAVVLEALRRELSHGER